MSESSREAVLARIRQGLAAGPAPLPPRPDFAAPVHPPLSSGDVVVAFAERFQQVGGEFHYCETLADLAAQLAAFRERQQREVPIFKDFEVTDAMLLHRDVIFIGRPESNSALAAWSERIGLNYQGAVIKAGGKAYSSERDSLQFAARNPLDTAHMVLVYAGNSPLETVQSVGLQSIGMTGPGGSAETAWVVMENGKAPERAPKGK